MRQGFIFISALLFSVLVQGQSLTSLAKNNQLLFFIEGRCSYCHRMAPELKQFAQQHDFTVQAYTLDGNTFAAFPKAEWIDERAFGIQIPVVPALFILNTQNQQITPLAYGYLSAEELHQRLLEYD